MELCAICGSPAECKHHLIFGTSKRKLADEDEIYISLCNRCHNMAVKPQDRIHGNSQAEALSKMLGQAMWERNYIADTGYGLEECRERFIERYGRNYL